jgi:hypothetical protein
MIDAIQKKFVFAENGQNTNLPLELNETTGEVEFKDTELGETLKDNYEKR